MSILFAFALLSVGGFSNPPSLASFDPSATAGGDHASHHPKLALNGRLVFFESAATTLDPADTTPDLDVYVLDQATSKIELVRLGDKDTDSTGDCSLIGVSTNGRYVAFTSADPAIAPGVDGFGVRAFVHDRIKKTTVLASATYKNVAIGGSVGEGYLSANGRFFAFTTPAVGVVKLPTLGAKQVYVRDLKKHKTELVTLTLSGSPTTVPCFTPKVSNNGRYVFFVSNDSGFVAGDTFASTDVLVRDRKTKTTSYAAYGSNGPLPSGCIDYAISSNGRAVAFAAGGDVVGDGGAVGGVYVRNLKAKTTVPAGKTPMGKSPGGCLTGDLAISKDGRYVVFSSYFADIVSVDPNSFTRDVFYADTVTGDITIASYGIAGAGASADCEQVAISEDASTVAFVSKASNLTQIPTNSIDQIYVTGK